MRDNQTCERQENLWRDRRTWQETSKPSRDKRTENKTQNPRTKPGTLARDPKVFVRVDREHGELMKHAKLWVPYFLTTVASEARERLASEREESELTKPGAHIQDSTGGGALRA